MNKILAVLVVVLILSVGAFVAGSQTERMAAGGWNAQEFHDLLKYVVKNHQGQYLGRINDFVVDPDGRISFAIISRPGVLGIRGKPVAIPFEALSPGKEKYEYLLDMSAEQFASVPNLDNVADLKNPLWAENIYRYFGVQPYWTEDGESRDVRP